MARKKSEFLSAIGIVFQIWGKIVDAVLKLGGGDDDFRRILTDPDLPDRIAQVIVDNKAADALSPSQRLAADLIPANWTVVKGEDVEPSQFKTADLRPVSYLKNGDGGWINTDKMRKRAVELQGNLGLSDGKRIVHEQDELSAEFNGVSYIPLPGTVLRSPDGRLCVPYLYRDGGRLVVFFDWVGCDWRDRGRFACSESSRP